MTPAVETAIIAALRAVPGLIHVAPMAEVAASAVSAQSTPAAYVGFAGFKVLEVAPDGRGAKIDETWAILIVTRSARQGDGGKEARHHTLSIARDALLTVAGLIPIENGDPLRPISPPGNPVWESGFYWLPLAFTHTTLLTQE